MENNVVTAYFHRGKTLKTLLAAIKKKCRNTNDPAAKRVIFYLTHHKMVIHHIANGQGLWMVTTNEDIFEYKYQSRRPCEIYSVTIAELESMIRFADSKNVLITFQGDGISLIDSPKECNGVTLINSENITDGVTEAEKRQYDLDLRRDMPQMPFLKISTEELTNRINKPSNNTQLRLTGNFLSIAGEINWRIEGISIIDQDETYTVDTSGEHIRILVDVKACINGALTRVYPLRDNDYTVLFFESDCLGFGKIYLQLTSA